MALALALPTTNYSHSTAVGSTTTNYSQELATKEAEVAELLAQVGPNKRGKTIVQLSLSSKPKPVGHTVHPVAGVPEFVSTLLSTLDPADALTFLKHEGLLTKVLGKRRRAEPEPEPESEAGAE